MEMKRERTEVRRDRRMEVRRDRRMEVKRKDGSEER